MRRIGALVGVCVVLMVTVMLVRGPHCWLPESLVEQLSSSTALHAVEEPIPAVPTLPRLEAPIWTLYLVVIGCLLIALLMLMRCHAAQCRLMRKPHKHHQPPSPL